MKEILLVTKGHPYEREPFYAVFDQMQDVNWTLVEQPAAQALFNVTEAQDYDAFVMYDMPGIAFRDDGPPEFLPPGERYKQNFKELLEAGHGFVFLHHAIAGWPAWPEYADIIGGRFLYMPAELRGEARQDSGYRHGVTHTVSVAGEHPVTAGLPQQFDITDELYLYEVYTDEVEPLLTSGHEFVRDNFYSAARVVRDGKMFDNEGWEHAPGSNLIGWTRTYGKSRIVYLQCGDDPVAYANPHFQSLLANAINWVSEA
jgi:type 1 glutamine amidotransferase